VKLPYKQSSYCETLAKNFIKAGFFRDRERTGACGWAKIVESIDGYDQFKKLVFNNPEFCLNICT